MYEFQEYPKWMYGPNKAAVIVQNRDGEGALGESWSPIPVADSNELNREAAVNVLSRVKDDEPSPEAVEEASWLDRAAALNLRVDRRWGIETLKGRVTEAEALAHA